MEKDQERNEMTAIILSLKDVERLKESGRRAGYAEAVARLRDNDRYRHWWYRSSADGEQYWSERARAHLADYLETVGPDGLDLTSPDLEPSGEG